MKNYFDSIDKMQTVFNRIKQSMLQFEQIARTDYLLSEKFLQASQQLSKISNVLSPEIMRLGSLQSAMASSIQEITKQQELFVNSFANYLTKWEPIFKKLDNYKALSYTIPENIYPLVDNLSVSIASAVPEQIIEPQIESLPIQMDNEKTAYEKLTWDKLILLIISVLTFFYMVYCGQVNANLQQKQHDEIIMKLDELITAIDDFQPNLSEHQSESSHNPKSD